MESKLLKMWKKLIKTLKPKFTFIVPTPENFSTNSIIFLNFLPYFDKILRKFTHF